MTTAPNVFNPKWLSEVELLDYNLEHSESLKPEKVESFFSDLASSENRESLTHGVINQLNKELQETVPWFLSQMPPLYLWTATQKTLMDDILEIISGKVLSEKQVAERHSTALQTVTLMAAGEKSNTTTKIASLISKYPGKVIRIFNSIDKKMGLCEVYQAPYAAIDITKDSLEKLTNLKEALQDNYTKYEKVIHSFDKEYVNIASIKQMMIALDAVQYCTENENSFVKLTPIYDEKTQQSRARVDIGLKNFPVNAAVEYIVGIFNRYNFQVRRILANEISINPQEKYTVIHLITANPDGEPINEYMKAWGKTLKSLKAIPYVDHGDECSTLLLGDNPYSINESNLVRAIANWVHIFLTKRNPYYYSLDRVTRIILNYPNHNELSIRYFRARFDPRFIGDREKAANEILDQIFAIHAEVLDPVEKNILIEGSNFLRHILKTNYFMISKGGLTFRLAPKCLNTEDYPETPFGIFYMFGRNFRAFQVRYRDIARGGMRVVMPRTEGDYENALAGLFDEVNGLASAQQLKNKDIPEGGSKCVMVLKPGANKNDAVKAAVSGLLDLINTDSVNGKLSRDIIDYYGKDEIIYLGPDENLTDDLIVWIIQHALHRKYKYAYAFMSSKPDFGINHKTYGVTSEGVNVYVDNVLRYLGLQNRNFRVKMTGGPDGDVAGNEMNILYREYGERCRLVAVADGFGAAFDPNGLDWKEILRLFQENKSIVEFNPEKLSKNSNAFAIAANTKENMKIRDNLYASVEAEIFIPGGGRPYTVKDSNWDKYLLPNGKPSSLAIVEGANIFFTKEARQKLVDNGAVVIKDSSANKAGVSCSSYEIIACLTISPEEFAQIKDIYVKQVLNIIRQNADHEAKLLFREWQRNKTNTDLVKLSYEVSAEINSAKDILLEKLNTLSDVELSDKKFSTVLFMHCPPILVEKYQERILERLPKAHKIAILSAYMASHLIYREGLHWLDSMSPHQIFTIALEYIEAEVQIEKMLEEIEKSGLTFKKDISQVLKHAGAKYLASHNL